MASRSPTTDLPRHGPFDLSSVLSTAAPPLPWQKRTIPAATVCRVGRAGGQVVAAQIAPTATGTEIICTMPSVPAPQEMIVQHSLNGQQYVGHEITSQNFTFHSPMEAIGVAPRSGPVDGATDVLLRLNNVSLSAQQLLTTLHPQFSCRFQDTLVPAQLDAPPPLLGDPSNTSWPNEVHANLSAHYDYLDLNAKSNQSGESLKARNSQHHRYIK